MKRLFLAAFLTLAPTYAFAGRCPDLNGQPDYADSDCVRIAHNIWAQKVGMANGNLAKDISKLMAAFARKPSQDLIDRRYALADKKYRLTIEAAAIEFMHDKLGYTLQEAKHFGQSTADLGEPSIVNTQINIWFLQVGYL